VKIKYEFITGEVVEIEVSDDIGEVSIEIDKAIYNSDRRETRRHNYINDMEERGFQFSDNTKEIPNIFELQQMNEALHAALGMLLPRQKALIILIYHENRSLSNIAKEEGVSEGAIRNRLNKIYKKLKIYLD